MATDRSVLRQQLERDFSPPELGPYFIRGCLQGAVLQGHDPVALLEAAGIPAGAYTDPAARVDGLQFQRLIMAVRSALNDEYMGYLTVPGKLGMRYLVARATVQCRTFGEAMTKFVKLVNAVRSDIDARCEAESPDVHTMSFSTRGFTPGVDAHLLSLINMFSFYKFQCWLIGQRIPLISVGFQSTPREGAGDYCRIFECPATFGGDRARISFPHRILSAPVIRNDVELRATDFGFGHPDWFAIPGSRQTFASRVEQLLVDLYRQGSGSVSLDVIGEMLRCSPRTLSRRLHRERVTFQQLKDRVRSQRAQKLLTSTALSVAEIAEEVGFSEPADFTRAYVAWTGVTPSEFRAQARRRETSAAAR